MDRSSNRGRTVARVGLLLTALGFVGYVAGIAEPYPWRAFSVTAVMVGITLASIGNAMRPEGSP